MSSWTTTLDEATLLATNAGKRHVVLFVLLCSLAALPTSFLVFSQVFTSATPEHWCSPHRDMALLNLTSEQVKEITLPRAPDGTYESCFMYDIDVSGLLVDVAQIPRWRLLQNDLDVLKTLARSHQGGTEPCRYGWTFSEAYYDRTLVTEMQLVCELGWWPRTSTTLFWTGSIFGNLLFGYLSDRYGRRLTILVMIFLEVPLAISTCFPPSYLVWTILRMFCGLFFPALYQLPFILALEILPPKMRTYTGMVIGMLFASGMCVLSCLGLLLRDWFTLSLATTVPFVTLYSYYWLVPESPRWLVGRGRVCEAEQVFRMMAEANGITLPRGFLLSIHRKEKLVDLTSPTSNGILDTGQNNQATNIKLDVESTKTTDMERMMSFEVEEIVTKKSRLKKEDKREAASLIKEDIVARRNTQESHNLNCTDENIITKPEDDCSIKEDIIELDDTDESQKAKCVQTDPQLIKDNSIVREKEANILDLMRYSNIRRKFLILTFDWIANGVVYNSLSYSTSNLGVNDYLAFFIGGVVELPAYVIAWKTMDRYGRRWVLCVAMCVGGLACLSCVFVPEERPWITVTLAMTGRLCVAASFSVFYVFVGELLPTVLRGQAMALSSFLSGVGLLACPYIVHLAVYSRVLPLVIVGLLSLSGAVASLLLPETLRQPLPQTTEDGQNYGRHFKILSCPPL